MKSNIIGNVNQNFLSLNSSNINKNHQSSLIYRKVKSPLLQNPKYELHRNASQDFIEVNRPRFNIDRKIAKSSYIKQRMENYSHLMNNMLSFKNIYNDFSFKKAPSFNENISEIHQIINGKRHKKIKYLDNLFFNSMFSNEYLDEIYRIRKNSILFQHDKNTVKILHRNNSSGQIIPFSHQRKYISRNEDSRELSTNHSNIIKARNNYSHISNNTNNNNAGGKRIRNNISNISTTTNKSINTNKAPEIYSNSNVSINQETENITPLPVISAQKRNQDIDMNNFDIDKIIPKNDGSFITSLGTEKMKYKLNELLFENGKKHKKINEFEKNILKVKILQIYQKENLEKFLNDDRFNIQERIDHIVKMYKIYENIYEEYQNDLARYINYLWLITSDFEVELQNEIKKKRELEYDVEVIVDKLLTNQRVLEYLIGLRNFLFTVKHKDEKIIKMNEEYILYKAKRSEFIDSLLNLFGRDPNTMATKYLKRLIEIEELEDLLTKKTRTRSITRKNTAKVFAQTENIEGVLSPPPPGEKIFDKPDDFFKIIEDLEDRNLSLLKENESIRIYNIKLKGELNKYIEIDNDKENIQYRKLIIEKMNQIKRLKEKNERLCKKRDYLIELFTQKNDDNESIAKLKIVSYNLFTNLSYFHRVNYNNLIIKYKYPFLLFLEKLIYNFNAMISSIDFKSLFTKEECNRYLPYDLFLVILRTKKENIDDKNQYLIIEYTLKLIKLYEYIGEYALRKMQEYKKKNEVLYKKYIEEIQNKRKVYNARKIRKLIENKREDAAKKLIEKWKKKPLINGRKLDLDEKPFYLEKKLNQELLKEKKKKEVIDEFENYKLLIKDNE